MEVLVLLSSQIESHRMITKLYNTDLQELHSLRLKASANCLIQFDETGDLPELQDSYIPGGTMFLGKGNNVLFQADYQGRIIQPRLYGIRNQQQDAETGLDLIEVGASEDWDEFVSWSIDHGYCGLENLSWIPGTVGAAPIQNIGAYGAEVKEFISSVKGWNFTLGRMEEYKTSQCKFGYRESIFKTELKDRFLITAVVFALSKEFKPRLNYGDLTRMLEGRVSLSCRDIREAVIQIRSSKLPDPKEIPNAGSFFKNPAVEIELANSLKLNYPELPLYPFDDNKVKLAAGWLIEKSGWKGKSLGKVAVHSKQALVLTNPLGGNGKDLLNLSQAIENDVFKTFGVKLEREVNCY